jgi:oxygen-independent coproporphyrinogen-3 oxidase
MTMSTDPADKYRVAAPRYTSYPTVPYWDQRQFRLEEYLERLVIANQDSEDGLSLYIHLPFCEDLCTYCGCNTRITKNHNVEIPYIHAVLKEWKLYCVHLGGRPVIREIHLGGGTPTFFSPENLEMLIKGIVGQAGLHPGAILSFEGHPKNTTAIHLATLHNLGFKRMSLGIQDFDLKVQEIINRIQSYESVADTTRIAREIGYESVNYDLIYGLPLQSLSGLSQTIEDVIRLRPDRIAFYSYAHVPWVKPGQRRYTEAHLPSAALKRDLYEMGRAKLIGAGYAEVGMDHFILPSDTLFKAAEKGLLHRNFMGYTEHFSKVMIGLGVSSISDCWLGFAQNTKTVEEYLSAVHEGRFPIVKGHLLDNSDLYFRQHILNIMCKGYTSWDLRDPLGADMSESLNRLQPMADDGLVLIAQGSLQVTPIGKRYLRNICMAFDIRLWAAQPATQLFSMAD